MTCYVRKFEGNATISFKISDKQLLRKYNQIWKKVKSLLNVKLDSEPVYGDNDKYIKTKTKTYGGSVITNFHGKNMPKEKALCKSLSTIMLDSVINRVQIWTKKDKDGEPYWWCLEKGSSDESDNEADNDSDDEKDNDESNE